jgi:hypothetical protein
VSLGDVTNALISLQNGSRGVHVPYRNSKLTYLLQDSLSHNSKVLMFVNVSPARSNSEETLYSLNFASRCGCVNLTGGQVGKDSPQATTRKPKCRVLKAEERELWSPSANSYALVVQQSDPSTLYYEEEAPEQHATNIRSGSASSDTKSTRCKSSDRSVRKTRALSALRQRPTGPLPTALAHRLSSVSRAKS